MEYIITSRRLGSLIGQLSHILIPNSTCKNEQLEAAWPSGQPVRLTIRQSRVQVPLWPLAGFVLGRPEFKSLALLVHVNTVFIRLTALGAY